MKKIFAIALSLALMLCCFGFASAEGSAEDIIVVGNPAQEIVFDDEVTLGYDAANEYYIVNGTEAVVLVKIPDYADPAQTYYQYPASNAEGFYYPTIYFTDLTVNEDGYYECPMPVDSMETTNYSMSGFQLYINQNGNQDEHYPDYLINIYADAANVDNWLDVNYPGVSWSYVEEPIETEEPIVTEPPVETEEPIVTEPPVETEEPVDPSDAPVDPSDAPVDPSASPVPGTPATGGIALVGVGVAAILAGAGVVLAKKKED